MRPAWARTTTVAHCDRDLRVLLWASADGAMRVSVGGRQVLDRRPGGPHRIGEHRLPVSLCRGPNTVEVLVEPGAEAFGFTVFLCDEHGESVPGIEYRLDDRT